MSTEIFLKKSDILPSLDVIVSGNGAAVNLTNATGVYARIKPRYSGSAIETSGGFRTKSDGSVFVNLTTNLFPVIGPYWVEFKIFFSGSEIRSYPQDGYINLQIESGFTV